jgi:uncharacterized protein (UPF0147 family)
VGEEAATASETAVAEAAEALRCMAEDEMEPRPVRRAAFNALYMLLRYAQSYLIKSELPESLLVVCAASWTIRSRWMCIRLAPQLL